MWFITLSSSVSGAWSGGENSQDLADRSHAHRKIGQDNILISSIGFRVNLTLFRFWLCYKQLCDLGWLQSVSVLYRNKGNKSLFLWGSPSTQSKNSY